MNKIIILLLWSNIISAQTRIRPGDAAINHALIKQGANTYKITIFDDQGKVKKDIRKVEETIIDTVKGNVIRIQTNYFSDGLVLIDSAVANLKTLAPERMRMITTPASPMKMRLSFRERSVHAAAYRNNIWEEGIHRMEPGYFDSNIIEYIIGLLPYKKGLSFVLNAYTYEENGLETFDVEYLGEDVLPGTPGFCYLVKITGSGKQQSGYAWYEVSTGIIQKCVFRLGNGLFVMTKG
jgi:hypothetical protein